MSLTTTGFIFLATILNFTLYVSKPDEIKQCSTVIDYDQTANDTYPERWSVMRMNKNYCYIDLRKNLSDVLINYKIRYVLKDQSHWLPSNEWRTILYSSNNYYEEKRKNNICIYSIIICFVLFAFSVMSFYIHKKLKMLGIY